MVNVVVVDTGLDENLINMYSKQLTLKYCFMEGDNYEQVVLQDGGVDEVGHGTAVFSLLYVQGDVHYTIIKLFGDDIFIEDSYLTAVLNYIYNNIECDILHMSCGTTLCEDIPALENACKKLTDSGVIIVAAFDNSGAISYPASFQQVIGVDMDIRMLKRSDYIFVKNSMVNIRAIGSEQRLQWLNKEHRYVSGASFAAPCITKLVIQYLLRGGYKAGVLRFLEENAKMIESAKTAVRVEFPAVNKMLLFPFNKEIQNLIRYADMISAEIVAVADIRELGRVGTKVKYTIAEANSALTIQDIECIDWNGTFDTIVIGHMKFHELLRKGIKKEIMKKATEARKNIVLLDTSCVDTESDYFCSTVSDQNISLGHYGKLYEVAKPVLAVMGTGPKQGKLAVQLSLRKHFVDSGYRVGQFGTEPTSFFYGFDECYPMGEESEVYVEGNKALQAVNYLMGRIERKNPDIIIAGCQSQTVASSYGNIGCHTIPQHEFLLGCKPDAIVLCTNYYDDFEYLDRTIQYIESVSEGKVIALMVSPMVRNNRWNILGSRQSYVESTRLRKKCAELTAQFMIPAYWLFDATENLKCYNTCVEFFTKD